MTQPTSPEASPWLDAEALIAARARANIIELSRQAETAVVQPRDTGAFPAQWRLAIAARIAALNGLANLAEHYLASITEPAFRNLGDPAQTGSDARERAVIAFMDKVAAEPRAVVAGDIEGLKAAGLAEADIVRLCELNAFMSYQCRVFAGLAVLKGAAA